MTDPKCARMMLKLAAGDARALDVMRDPETVTEEVFGFHLQQAAEKALKAWIAVLGGLIAAVDVRVSVRGLLARLGRSSGNPPPAAGRRPPGGRGRAADAGCGYLSQRPGRSSWMASSSRGT